MPRAETVGGSGYGCYYSLVLGRVVGLAPSDQRWERNIQRYFMNRTELNGEPICRAYMVKQDARGGDIFYSLHLCQDMFSGWSVVREYGALGSEGRVLSSPVPTEQLASNQLENIVSTNLKRGYKLLHIR